MPGIMMNNYFRFCRLKQFSLTRFKMENSLRWERSIMSFPAKTDNRNNNWPYKCTTLYAVIESTWQVPIYARLTQFYPLPIYNNPSCYYSPSIRVADMIYRTNCSYMLYKTVVLKNVKKFIGKHLWVFFQ